MVEQSNQEGGMDFSNLGNQDGRTTEEKIQDEIAGDSILLTFQRTDQNAPFWEETFKQGMTFEWVKNKVAE